MLASRSKQACVSFAHSVVQTILDGSADTVMTVVFQSLLTAYLEQEIQDVGVRKTGVNVTKRLFFLDAGPRPEIRTLTDSQLTFPSTSSKRVF